MTKLHLDTLLKHKVDFLLQKLLQTKFETRVSGKWILAGEHAVLRGGPALVFPLNSRRLSLSFVPDYKNLNLILSGPHGDEYQLLFWGVLEKACELCGIQRSKLTGTFLIESSLPVGTGLGASAALCVAVTRWLAQCDLVPQPYEFARSLENMFHGESSGVDIAVALSGQGLRFTRAGERKALNLDWQPQWYISYSGKRGVTLECVEKVKGLLAKKSELGLQLDQQMIAATEQAEQALLKKDLSALVDAINLAGNCFIQWGLSPESHIQWLQENGALAVKPTGSGGGGYVLSLWKQTPPKEILAELISCGV